MKFLNVISVLLFSHSLSAQIRGIIYDLESEEPLPYVNVWYRGTTIGTFSNEKGEFQLPKNDSTIISFSSVGYGRISYQLEGLETELDIRLKSEPFSLATIEVKPDNQWKSTVLGSKRGKKFPFLGISFWEYKKQFWKLVIPNEERNEGFVNGIHIGLVDHFPAEGTMIINLFLTEGIEEHPLLDKSIAFKINLSNLGDELFFDIENLNIPLHQIMNVYLTFIGVQNEYSFDGGLLDVKLAKGIFKEPMLFHKSTQDEGWNTYPPNTIKYDAINVWVDVDVRN